MNTVYLEFLVDKFVKHVQSAEQVSLELPLLSKFQEIMKILQAKKFVPEKLIEIKGELQEINDLFAEFIGGKRIFFPTWTGKDPWHLRKTGQKLSVIINRLHQINNNSVNEEERKPKTARVLVIEKEDLAGINSSEYHGLDDQMVEIETLLSKNEGNMAIGIMGIYGSGKSVLARKVVLGSNVKKLFELVFWIDLSEVMGSEEIYEFRIKGKGDYLIPSSIGFELHAWLSDWFPQFRTKKRLVVLDGVRIQLNGLKRFIEQTLVSGSVIVTSTVPEVHRNLLPTNQNSHLYRIKGLKKEACWRIFEDIIKRKYLLTRDEFVPITTTDISKMKDEILFRCDGLPLAVKIMAETISVQIARRTYAIS